MADKIRVLLTEEEVDKRINEVAEQINKDYAGKSVHLICILKGGVFFTCELAKRLNMPVSMDFMSVSSYGAGTVSSGVVRIIKECPDRRRYHRFRPYPGLPDRSIKAERTEGYPSLYPS